MRPTPRLPAALAAASLLAAACGGPRTQVAPGPETSQAPPQAVYLGEPYAPPPPVRTGSDGVFRTRLVADTGSYAVRDTLRPTVTFNRTLNPPVLRMSPGDSVDMWVVDSMPASAQSYTRWTNYHYHGFNVRSMPPADNVTFIHIGQDSSFHYQFGLPEDIPQGMHWYHPHPHGISQMQLQRGMSGVISVGDVLGEVGYDSAAIAERFMLIRDFSYVDTTHFNSCWGPNWPYPLMNGQPLTHLTMRPGETQFWRIANVGSDRVYNLRLQGKRSGRIPMQVVARDGNAVAVEYPVDSILLSPGNRWEVLVTAPAVTDTLQLWTPPLDRDSEGCTFPPATFAYVTVEASPLLGAPRAMAFDAEGSEAQSDTIRMLQAATAVQKFDVVFSRDTFTGDTFLINGVAYDPRVTNRYVAIDSVQEWTVYNDDFDLHAFHIHQGDFLVVATRDSGAVEWEPVPPNGRIDTIMIPRHGAAKIRFVYTDPRLAGMFVYHCHMLFHEDRGMMQNLCLYDPSSGKTPDEQCANPFATMGGMGGGGHGGHVMQ